ncbi:MAG: HAD-IC family P-type ATPase, partial [Pseudomonadota bacterium]
MRNATSSIRSTTDPAVAPEQGWHAAEAEAVLAAVNGSADGLTQQEAAERLAVFGPNALPGARPRSALLRFLLQFHNLLIYVLLAAGVLSAAIGHITDAAVIFGVVLINAVIGFVQEGRAEKALDAIQKMIEPHAAVLRGGRRVTVAADQVVPGDVVVLEAGDRVPADLRIVRARNLRIDEAILTGESVPVDKGSAAVAADAALGD